MNDHIKINSIKWEIENCCNLHCRHCFLGENSKKINMINYEDAIKMVDKLVEYGIKSISFTTMEPLMFEGIVDLVNYCSSYGIFTILLTNGILLADYKLAEKLVKAGVGMISFSLEGISEQSNDYIRGKGTLSKVLTALSNLSQVQQHFNHIQVGLQMTLNRFNVNEAEEIPRFINNLPIDILQISGIVDVGNAKDNPNLKLTDQEINIAWGKMQESYNQLSKKNFYLINKTLVPFENALSNLVNKTDYMPIALSCSAIRDDGFSIMPDGRLIPCIAFADIENLDLEISKDVTLFNLSRNYDKLNIARAKIKNYINGSNNEICRDCYFGSYCYTCPVELNRNKSMAYITDRCSEAKNKIDLELENILQSPNSYTLSLRQDVLMKIDQNTIHMKRQYNIGNTIKDKSFFIDDNGISLIKELINNNYLGVNYITSNYFNENIRKTKDFLKPLIYDNFILIEKRDEKNG